jgi:hypothetical protein
MVKQVDNLSSKENTETNNILSFQEQYKTVMCMDYIFGEKLAEEYLAMIELTLDTEEKWERYFAMV